MNAKYGLVVVLGALLAAATVALLISRPSRQEAAVLGRLGNDGASALPAPVPAQKVKLAASTRSAVRVAANSRFETEAPPGTTKVALSIGESDAATAASGKSTFAVQQRVGGEWRTILASELDDPTAGWRDYEIAITGEPGAQPVELAFETRTPGSTGAAARELFWGSVNAIGLRATGPFSRSVPRPNVILISLDTLGAGHLSSFGNEPGVSPFLDDLFARGFSWRRAYAHYPSTLISHASLFTGLLPVSHGVSLFDPLLRIETLADVFAKAGYSTVAFTENAFVSSDFGFDRGFDEYDNGETMVIQGGEGFAERTFARATHWLAENGARTPFFMFIHTYEVHAPYRPRDEQARRVTDRIDPGYDGRYRDSYPGNLDELAHNSGDRLLTEREMKHLAALYAGEINYLDRVVARFFAALEGMPLGDQTLVVLTSDHGEAFGEHGRVGHGETLFNQVLHVPLAFYWPGKIPPGSADTPVQLADVMPTILDLVGLSTTRKFDGVSLKMAMESGAEVPPNRPIFAELATAWGECRRMQLPDGCPTRRLAVQTDRFKLMTSELPPSQALYDLQADPGEMHDVAAQYPVELARYREYLRTYEARQALPPASDDAPPEVGAETREKLRQLGYME